ncbi:MAG: STT3 domain-containing protein, partial [Candidatus Heimdallarchaeota archaeon]
MRALRTGSLIYSILSGVSLGLLILSWGAATFAVQLISLYVVILILVKKYSDRLLTAFGGTILVAFALAINLPRIGPSLLLDIDGLIPLGVLGILILVSFYQTNKDKINSYPFLTGRNLELAGYGIVAFGFAFMIFNFFVPIIPSFRGKFITVIIPFFREGQPILKSVAEHLIVTWASLFRNLFILVFLIPIGILYAYKKPTERNIFLLIYIMTTLYFSGSMVRLILILAPAAVITGAKALEETLLPYAMVLQEKFFLSKRKRAVSRSIGNEHVSIAFVVVFVVLLFNLFQGITISQQILSPSSVTLSFQTPSGVVEYGDWFETFDWIKRETPTSSVLSSWWDYGYWETLANRTTVVDNATLNSTKIGNIGAMMMSTPDIALKIASYYDIDYIIVLVSAGQQGLDNDIGKVQWMIKIGEASGSIDHALGAPIVSDDYFNYADNGEIIGYDGKFYTSLIWAIMTYYEDEAVAEPIQQAYSRNQIISATLTPDLYGFASQYEEIYSQIFVEAFFST